MTATTQRETRFGCERRASAGVTVFEVTGDLDLSTAPELCGRVEQTFREGGARVVIDLSRIAFCDSSGLRALFGAAQEARVHGVPLRIVAPRSASAARALEIAGGIEFLPLAAGAREAVAELTR